MEIPEKTKNKTTLLPSKPTTEVYIQGNKITKDTSAIHVYYNRTHNG